MHQLTRCTSRAAVAVIISLFTACTGPGTQNTPPAAPNGSGNATPGPQPQGCTSYAPFGTPVATMSQALPNAFYSSDYQTNVSAGADMLVEWQIPAGQCSSDALAFAYTAMGGNGVSATTYYGYLPVSVAIYFVRPTTSPQPSFASLEDAPISYRNASGIVAYQSPVLRNTMWAVLAPSPGPWNVYAHFFDATLVPAGGTQSQCGGGSCQFATSYHTLAPPYVDTLDSTTSYQRLTTSFPEVTPSP